MVEACCAGNYAYNLSGQTKCKFKPFVFFKLHHPSSLAFFNQPGQ